MSLAPLLAPTPAAWVEAAVAQWPQLLADHANCEKKAASTALALMFAGLMAAAFGYYCLTSQHRVAAKDA